MNILFDVFVLLKGSEDEMTPEEAATFYEIKIYFEQRLNPLKDQMDAEELKDACCVMIHILPPQEEWALPKEQRSDKVRISVNGYNPELNKKIHESFTQADFEIINKRLDNIAGRFRN